MIKYRIPYSAHDNTKWNIDIENDAYTGSINLVRGVSEQAGILTYNGETDNPFTILMDSALEINIINEGQIDLNELQQSQDRQWKVKLYRSTILYWSGFLISDAIQYPLLSAPNTIRLSAVCGLTLLDNMPYVHADLPGGRVPMNYFRQILFNNLGVILPIRWTNSLQCTAFIGEDVFVGGVQWSVNNEGFYSYQSGSDGDSQGPIKSCRYILEGLLKAFQCRIFQANGRWTIRRVNDYVTGYINYKQIAGALAEMTVVSGSENIKNQVGRSGYSFENEDQIITSRPGIKTARITYAANVRSNILPNGNQDIVEDTHLLYWGFYGTSVDVIVDNSLDGRDGHSAYLISSVPVDDWYTTKPVGSTLGNDGLPIDTLTMIKYINFGFLFSPTAGFPLDGSGFIDWSTAPFQIKVIFNAGATKYYLNEFGFWQTTPTAISITVDGLRQGDVTRVDFNKFQNIIMPTPDAQPVAGDTSDIVVEFLVKAGQQYKLDNIYINIDKGNDVYEATLASSTNTTVDEDTLDISSSFGGYQLSNLMTNWSNSDSECFYREGLLNPGTLTQLAARSIMKFKYKASKVYNGSMNTRNANWSFDEIYLIDSFGMTTFLPMPGTKYNTEKAEVFLVAMECRSDNSVIFTEKYYNSNDNQLSN